MFTQQLYRETKPAFIGGLFVSFFFSLRFAIQANYLWGVHPLRIVDQTDQLTTYTSQMSLSQLGFDMKYYLNTQNVTQGLAIINPYFIIGADRLVQIIQIRDFREGRLEPKSIFGFHGGIGIEFPFTLNKAFIGIEVQYQYVQLPRRLYDLESSPKSLPNQGDILKGLAIIGINF